MKHDGSTSKLNAILRSNAVAAPPPASKERPDPVELLVHSFMVWEATTAQADAAMARIKTAVVSFNDFRVSLVKEVVELIGPRYPLVQERAIRVRAALNDLYRREYAVSLDRVSGLSKRDARAYLESLQGMVPFVAARVALLGLDAHAVPVDDQTLMMLVHHGALHRETTVVEATGWLQRHIPADRALASHLALQRAAEAFVAKVTPRGVARMIAEAEAARVARMPRVVAEPPPTEAETSATQPSRGGGSAARASKSAAGRKGTPATGASNGKPAPSRTKEKAARGGKTPAAPRPKPKKSSAGSAGRSKSSRPSGAKTSRGARPSSRAPARVANAKRSSRRAKPASRPAKGSTRASGQASRRKAGKAARK